MSFFEQIAMQLFATLSGIVALFTGFVNPPPAADFALTSDVYVPQEEAVYAEADFAEDPVITGEPIPSGLEEGWQAEDVLESAPQEVPPKEKPPVKELPVALVAAAPPAPSALKEFAFDPAWKDAVVNLFCMDRYGGYDYSGSGSGVVVDPRGVILTNAHVVWPYMAFAEWPNPSLYQCSVRIGSPAKPFYKAQLLYVPQEYMEKAFARMYDYQAEEKHIYGENDYAFLLITGRTDVSATLPTSFPYRPIYTGPVLGEGSFIYDVGYPAGYLGGLTMQNSLGQAASPTRIFQRKSIKGTTDINIFSYLADIAGQAGSSGGPVFKAGGEVAGLNTFVDEFASNTSEQILYAVSGWYINEDLKRDSGLSLGEFLAQGDFSARSKAFMDDSAAKYQRLYVDSWRKNQDIIVPGVTY